MGPTVEKILSEHVSLVVSCVDRIYVNGYVGKLQTPGQLVYFLHDHLGNPVASPAVLGQRGDRHRAEVDQFVAQQGIPVVHFRRGQRKDEVANELRRKRQIEDGVVFLGVAQERCTSFKASKRSYPSGVISFDFAKQSVFVNHLYFYVEDRDWGPAFVKIGTYAPYPIKLCLNGHEWVKQQLRREGVGFESLDNGFRSCAQPARLQQLCEQLGPAQVQSFFDRWSQIIPWPLTAEDQRAGFRHLLSLWQIELSLTHVFERPVDGRHFFDSVIRGNLDLGRPQRVRLLFPRRFTARTPTPAYGYRTRVITADVDPSLHVEYKRCHVKQYFKEGRALRTETTINDPTDFAIAKALANMPQLKEIGHIVNQRLLTTERLADDCTLDTHQLDALQSPATCGDQRVCAFRFGDPRVMALFAALCLFTLHVHPFRNRDLRAIVEKLRGPYTANQMTYDLRRLRQRGLINRLPGTHRYLLTPAGLRVAFLFTKLYQRILKPAWAALLPAPTTPEHLRTALRQLDDHLEQIIANAKLAAAA